MYDILINTATVRDTPTEIPTIVIIMVNFVLRNQPATESKGKTSQNTCSTQPQPF
jgi:hypothetical protein